MTIRNKLVINSLITFAGFVAVVLLGFITIRTFQDNMRELTTRSTPLQLKMLQFQQVVEQISGDLFQTGFLDNPAELEQVTARMGERRKRLDSLNHEIQELKGSQMDVTAFSSLENQVAITVKNKFASLETFKAEAANLGGAIRTAEKSLDGIRDLISGLRSTAARRTQSYAKDLDRALKGEAVTGLEAGVGLAEKVQNYRNGVESDMAINQRVLAAVEAVDGIHVDLRLLDAKTRMVMLSSSPEELDRLVAEIGQIQARVRKGLKQAETEVSAVKSGGIVQDAIDEIAGGVHRATTAVAKIVAAQRNVLTSMAQVDATVVMIKSTAQEQARQSEAKVSATTAEQQQIVQTMLVTSRQRTLSMLGAALLIGALVLVLNGLLIVGIRRPLALLRDTITQIAETRDLRRSVQASGSDEIGQSINAFNALIGSIRGIVAAISGTAKTLATTSRELSGTVGLITSQVREQSDRIGQVAAASAQLSQTVAEVASNTTQIADSSEQARRTADTGASVVNQTIHEVQAIARAVEESRVTIAGLHERSQQIEEILDTIREITDQTSLLALNAAIEAARAGEHGLGFAVVANEVRNLARKAESATVEIAEKLSGIQLDAGKSVEAMQQSLSRVANGVELSEQAGRALTSIVGSVEGLQGMAQQIATATEELSATAGHISDDIMAVDAVLRETLQATDVIAEESVRLASVSQELQHELDQFEYDEPQEQRHKSEVWGAGAGLELRGVLA